MISRPYRCFESFQTGKELTREQRRPDRRRRKGIRIFYRFPRLVYNIPPKRSVRNFWREKETISVELCRPSVDENGNLLSVPMKLEMEIKNDCSKWQLGDRVYDLMTSYRIEFISAGRLCGIEIISVDEIQFILEGHKCVSLFQVACHNWQSSLIPFINLFFVNVRRFLVANHEIPVISTHSLLLYPLRLIKQHTNIALTGVHFGSLLDNGRLGIHWIMTGGPTTIADKVQGFNFHKGIYAFFDYDKHNIEIKYCNYETNLYNPEGDFLVRGRIMIDMASVNRIFFDQKFTHGNGRCFSLVLLLDSPPKFSVQRRIERTKEFVGVPQWEFRAELQRGRYPGEVSDRKALHDSKVVVLEFDTGQLRGKLTSPYLLEPFYYDLISRLRHITGRMIEFTSFSYVELSEGELKHCCWDERERRFRLNLYPEQEFPYFIDILRCDRKKMEIFDDKVKEFIMNASEKLVAREGKLSGLSREEHLRLKAFRLHALLQGILDRGMEFRIELLRYRQVWYNFVEMVSAWYFKDEHKTLHALERVMCCISEGRPPYYIPKLFHKEWIESTLERRMAVFSDRDRTEGYWRIMKLVATPSRVIFVGYEVIMGNRVLNKYAKNENHIIRLAFREDNGGHMRIMNYGPEIQASIRRYLVEGITYAGRTFHWLGNSNSQLRDQGCYMIYVDPGCNRRMAPQDIHKQMGRFELLPNIPKILARLGQLFTQTRTSERAISMNDVGVTCDFTGGRNSAGKPYTFSDGVGRISAKYATILSREHGANTTASAFQIRFRGEKGMLSVDPLIDKRTELMMMMGRHAEKKVLMRPSMTKFHVEREESSHMEIVKLSSSSALLLNRPFINILCQVSSRQSAECHKRVRDRLMELMHLMSREGMQSLYIEEKAIDSIKEMTFPFMMEVFTPSCGFNFTTEPFFRSLLLANCKYLFQKRLSKMNIRVPSSNGRLMFGVVDTTGLLQHGQIFCQYSGSVSKHASEARSMGGRRGIVLSGPTMITKNPCISSGDVRMFDAIDIPALRHLIDVVVFPMHGPRPHPDEMAGSDLDGDEYMVIWDKGLLLERNEEASLYPTGHELKKWAIPKKSNGEIDFDLCEERKADFFTEAIVHGQPGLLCSAHLAVSDLYGLDSKPAKSLAEKISITIDYQKSGILPEDMTTFSTVDPDNRKRIIPAERSELKPDFLRNYRKPGYQSRGILGEVFRESNKYEHALECVEEQKEIIELDPTFVISGWETYEHFVTEELANYTYEMKNVMEHYGIATEEELLSGMIIHVKNRLSDNDEVDGTLFTTNRVIEGKVRRIIEIAREKFFETFVEWREELEEVKSKRSDVTSDSVLHRIVKSDTLNIEDIRRKASAAYKIAYMAANVSVQKGEKCAILLSFPWIFYDVLLDIKMRPHAILESQQEKKRSNIPIARNISEFIDRYCDIKSSNWHRYDMFMERFYYDNTIVSQSMRENEGLSRATFVLVEWANQVGVIGRGFREDNLVSLFVLFGLGWINTRARKLIQLPTGDPREHGKKGEHLLLFFDYISSEEFRTRSSLSFEKLKGGTLLRGEWRKLTESALSSFLSLVTTLRLPIERERGIPAMTAKVKEFQPRIMQLPGEVIKYKLEEVRDALGRVSGCREISLRSVSAQLVIVSAIGTSEQLRVLTSFIYPPAPPREEATLIGKIEALPSFTVSRLMKAAKETTGHM